MSKYQTPYRYDFVGSFLRPQEVKQAKADYSEGKITKKNVMLSLIRQSQK